MGVFKKQGVYWIDYYVNSHRKRERIGPDKKLVDTVLKKRKVEIAEGKFLEKRQPITSTFDELVDAYLKWISPDERAGVPARKRSWKTLDVYAIKHLQAYFGGRRLTDMTPTLVEQYRAHRKAAPSRYKRPVSPTTVNRELAVLKRMLTVACQGLILLKGGVPASNPIARVSLEREYNERDRVLSPDEFSQLSEVAEPWFRPMLQIAYYTGMRRGEIRALRWEQMDLKQGLLRLRSGDTKTGEGRLIPLNPIVIAALQAQPRYLGCRWVFVNPARMAAWRGSPSTVDPRYHEASLTLAFVRACRKTGIANATFHDLRHTFATNARRAGIDYFRIMAITGHKTMLVFKRYNTVDERDLRQAMGQLDTYLDTTPDDTDHPAHASH
jgi:integrase